MYYLFCAAVGALESHLALKTGQFRNISEQNLIDCNRNAKTGGLLQDFNYN